MAKDKGLLLRARELERLRRNIDTLLPQIYSGMALALHRRYGFGTKRINDAFMESQEIWQWCVDNNVDMLALCEEETGIIIKEVCFNDSRTN